MATTSLWHDELFSIAHYSAKGPLFTMTHYAQPNNHILFNLLNSLTPGQDYFNPARARLWSFIFAALSFLSIVLSQALAGHVFEGSFQGFFFLANLSNLDLILQARGYSILAFAAVLCTVLTWEYFRKPSLVPLVGVAIVVWLGTWSVPTFVLFGAPLFLVLLIYSRDWRWLLSGSLALLAICLAYWPVHAALLHNSESYGSQWGKDFANWSAIGDIFSSYLVFGMSSWLTFLVIAAAIVAFLLGRIQTPAEKASFCLGITILLTFAACLKMETPLTRTVAFTVVPFAFIVTTLLGRLLCLLNSRWLRLSVTFGIAIAAFAFALHVRGSFRFIPIEAWRETALKIEEKFPKGTEIVAQFRPEWLKAYLSVDYPFTSRLDTAKFITGKQIVVDSSITPEKRFPTKVLPEGYAVTTVRQHRGKKQRIYFWPST